MLLFNYSICVIIDLNDCVLKISFRLIKLNLSFLGDVGSPFDKSKSHVVAWKHPKEICNGSICLFVQPSLTSSQPNSLENLNSQCSSSNSSYNIYSILFLADVISPSPKNVSSFLDISIILNSVKMGLKCRLETS